MNRSARIDISCVNPSFPCVPCPFIQSLVDFELSPQAVQWLANKGFHEHYGARELERVMERELLLLLTPYVPLAMAEQPVHKLRVEVVDKMLQVVGK